MEQIENQEKIYSDEIRLKQIMPWNIKTLQLNLSVTDMIVTKKWGRYRQDGCPLFKGNLCKSIGWWDYE